VRLYVQYLVFNLRNILCTSLVLSLHSTDTAIGDFLHHQPSRFCIQLVNNEKYISAISFPAMPVPSTQHRKSEHFYGVGSVSVHCSLVHYQYTKANDSSSYEILCRSKDNLTLRWSVQNVWVNVKSKMTEIRRPTSVVCIYENQGKKKYPE
jgi:hypothetical protein